MKIHANFKLFAATHFDGSKYITSPSYGVNRFMLDRIGNEKARATTIVEYQPNSKFPRHTHIGGEEFLVLKGTFKDEHGSFGPLTYVRNPIDSQHAPWVDDDGCTIFVKLLQMADTRDLDEPLYVDILAKEKNQSTISTAYGKRLPLYANKITGETVEMCWMNPNQSLDVGVGGEELLVVDGTVKHEDSVYQKWAWLRFPDHEQPRDAVLAGPDGAQVFRKTNHLTEKALKLEKIQITEEEDA